MTNFYLRKGEKRISKNILATSIKLGHKCFNKQEDLFNWNLQYLLNMESQYNKAAILIAKMYKENFREMLKKTSEGSKNI